MNMLLHGVKDTGFEIFHGDTLTNDWDILRELNPAQKPAFDAIVANPSFSAGGSPPTRWRTMCCSSTRPSIPSKASARTR